MKLLLVLPIAILVGAASAPPADLQTGRSVAVERPGQQYWLSDDLNRLFLQKPSALRGKPAGSDTTQR